MELRVSNNQVNDFRRLWKRCKAGLKLVIENLVGLLKRKIIIKRSKVKNRR